DAGGRDGGAHDVGPMDAAMDADVGDAAFDAAALDAAPPPDAGHDAGPPDSGPDVGPPGGCYPVDYPAAFPGDDLGGDDWTTFASPFFATYCNRCHSTSLVTLEER